MERVHRFSGLEFVDGFQLVALVFVDRYNDAVIDDVVILVDGVIIDSAFAVVT